MEQIKCGDVFRDTDGNFNYTCTCCDFEFMSAMDFEEHVIHHYLELDEIKEESIKEESTQPTHSNRLIKIEPVLEEHADDMVDERSDHNEEDDYEEEELPDDVDEYVIEECDDTSADDATQSDSAEDTEVFKCDCCDKLYACKGLKEQHIHKYSDVKSSCEMCPAYYEKETELNAHKKIHNLANTLSCPHCMEIFASPIKLKRHMTCSKLSSSNRKKTSTTSVPVHTPKRSNKKQKFVCDICQKEYSYMYYLKKHLKRHSENTLTHTCDACGHEFKLRQNLMAHMRTHTGEKPFVCKLCGKAFNQPYYMTIHMRIHQKEKPYQCSLCGVSFVTSSHLGRHMKSHNNIKPHKCTICERAFILPGHLRDHMRSQHTGERPFSCDVCGNTFARRKLLRQHMQLHGEKRFKCKYCDLPFSQSAGRRGHEIRVHNAS